MQDEQDHSAGMTPPEVASPPAASKWPTVIGVFSIVFASFGLLCYGCGSLNVIASPILVNALPEGQRPVTPQGAHFVVQVFQACASFGLSVWLLIAGIGTARRRAWSRTHHVGWSIAKIILTVLSVGAAIVFAEQVAQQLNDQMSQGGQVKMPFTVTPSMIVMFALFSALWQFVWPVFLIAWFSRGAIRLEVEAWEAESRAMI